MEKATLGSSEMAETDRQAYERFQRRERCDLALLHPGSMDASEMVRQLVAADIELLGQVPETHYRPALCLDRLHVEIPSSRRDIIGWTLYGLGPYFRWGLAETAWSIEQRRSSIPNVESILNARLDSGGRALYERMFVLFRMAASDDLAEELPAYLADHPQDFLARQTLGNLLFFRRGRVCEALQHYEAAAVAAVSRSRYHASYAYLHAAYLHYLCQDYQGAVQDARAASEISPNLFEAAFQYAQYCALTGKEAEAIQNLTKAILSDRYYCVRIALECDFDPIRGDIGSLIEGLRDKARRDAKEALSRAGRALQIADIAGCRRRDAYHFQVLTKQYSQAESLLERDTYFECMDAQEIAEQLREQTFRVTRGVLESNLRELKAEISARRSEMQEITSSQSNDASRLVQDLDAQEKRIQQENQLFMNILAIVFVAGILNLAYFVYANMDLRLILNIFVVSLGELGLLWLIRWGTLRSRLEQLRMRRRALNLQQERNIESLRKRIHQAEKKQTELGQILHEIQEQRVA